MTSSGAVFFWLSLGAVALATIGISKAFKFVLTNTTGKRELVEEGLILTERGIETYRFLTGKREIAYEQIEQVHYVPFPKNLLLRRQYGPAIVSRVRNRSFRGSILIKLKQPCSMKYLVFDPSNPAELAQRISVNLE